MDNLIPTVAIVNKDAKSGFTIINEGDFDEKTHKLYKGKLPAGQPEGGAEPKIEPPVEKVNPPVHLDPVTEARLDAIDIPEDWADMKFLSMKSLAGKISGNSDLPNKDAVVSVIEAEIARRGDAA